MMRHKYSLNLSTLCVKKLCQLWQAVVLINLKLGLILMIFGQQHQHTFKNDMHIQLSLSPHFYLLYLLLNSCDGNDAKRFLR